MRKVLTLLAIPLLFGACNDSKKIVENEWKVYRSTMEIGDVSTAIVSLNRIIALEKYNGDALDTLAILYLNAGSNNAALKVGKRALNIRESDALNQVLAKANKNLGKYEEALPYFSKLLVKNPEDLELMYEVAFVNINLGKGNEALPLIQQIIAHPNSGSAVMQEYHQNGSQLLPYKAVAFNMLGFMQTQVGQNEDALQSYRTALSIFPKYALAQNNLNVLMTKMKK